MGGGGWEGEGERGRGSGVAHPVHVVPVILRSTCLVLVAAHECESEATNSARASIVHGQAPSCVVCRPGVLGYCKGALEQLCCSHLELLSLELFS